MRYSLVSRFRGALIGALLGEALAKDGEGKFQDSHNLGETAVLSAESLIEQGTLDLNHWLERQQKASFPLDKTDELLAKAIFATIPVALFFHENTTKLQQNLLLLSKIWKDDLVVRDGILAVGYAIAQSLTEKVEPRTLIPQIVHFIGETPTSLPQKLLKVNTLLGQGAGIERVQSELSREENYSHAIAMAFYCFLSTLEDFRLAVLRSAHSGHIWQQDSWVLRSQTISAITGALSGAYNSTVGIPANWRVLRSLANSKAQELTSFSQMLELADVLAVVWSGIYNIPLNPRALEEQGYIIADKQTLLCVYAAPRVIRWR